MTSLVTNQEFKLQPLQLLREDMQLKLPVGVLAVMVSIGMQRILGAPSGVKTDIS